jgi:DNA-binding Lrp family transcriptional regulator
VAAVTDDAAIWESISALAKRLGRDKGVVSRRVARLEKQGLLTTRRGEGGTKLVQSAEFDRAVADFTDGVRALNGTPDTSTAAAAVVPGDPTLSREQARRAGYDADLKRLDLQERLGELGKVADFRASMRLCAEGVVQVLEQLPGRVEEIEAALAKGGLSEGRAVILALFHEKRELIDRSMTALIERERQAQLEAADQEDAA